MRELFQTEQTYLRTLTILAEDLQRPLEEAVQIGRPIISESDIRSVFSSVGIIRNYNKYFLERLAPRVAGWEEHQQIGDVLLELVGSPRETFDPFRVPNTPFSEPVA